MAKVSTDLESFLQENFEKQDSKWFIRESDFPNLDKHIPFRSRLALFIPSIINRLNKAKTEFTIDDLYQDLIPLLVNGKTPEKKEIIAVLENFASETPSGNWRKRRGVRQLDIFSAASKASESLPEFPESHDHDKIIESIAHFGNVAGCSIHIGKNERRHNKDLALLSVESLPLQGLPKDALRIIEQIDVVWLRDSTVVAAFEVEGTTAVYSGLGRLDELVKSVPNISIRCFIVHPKDREELVRRQFSRQSFQAVARKEKWRLIDYESLYATYDAIRREKIRISPETLDLIGSSPFS
jgi:hypothetical protein